MKLHLSMNAGDQEPLVPPLLARQVPELGQVAHLLTCHICYEPAHLPAISPCHHLFCSLCIRKFLKYNQVCPSCHAELHESSLRQDQTTERILELIRPLAASVGTRIDDIMDTISQSQEANRAPGI